MMNNSPPQNAVPVDINQQNAIPQGYYHPLNTYVVDWPPRRGSRRNLKRSYYADWAFVVATLACCAIWFADPIGHKYFRLDDPNLSYPDVDDVVFPSWLLHVLYWFPPLIIISLAQIWLRNFAEWHHTLLSFIETIAIAYFTTTFLMWSVGGLRPSWLSVCKPSQTITPGYPYQFFTQSICTADSGDLRTAQQTFPSGHAATIFASYGWLVFYLNAKLKIFDGNAHAWKLIAFLPLLFGTWISFSRVNDAKHTNFDICAGILLGYAIAVIGYRLNFASLFGPDNHIILRLTWDYPPLPPHQLYATMYNNSYNNNNQQMRSINSLRPKYDADYPNVSAQGVPMQ